MIRGEAYINSSQEQRLNRIFAAALRPCAEVLEAIAQRAFIPHGEGPLFWQERVGRAGEIFKIAKISTFDSEGKPLSDFAETLRENGLDESSQWRNIERGHMGAVGWRPMTREDLDLQYNVVGSDSEGARLVDRHYRRVVKNSRPGCISPYVVRAHRGEVNLEGRDALIERIEGDLRLVADKSLLTDLALMHFTFGSILRHKMKQSSTTISDSGDA